MDDYLPWEEVSEILGVGKRRIRGIATEENIEKAYYSKGGQEDLVCYRISDVERVAQVRRNTWPEKLKNVIPVGDTYPKMRKIERQVEEAKQQFAEMTVPAQATPAPALPAHFEEFLPILDHIRKEISIGRDQVHHELSMTRAELAKARKAANLRTLFEIAVGLGILLAMGLSLSRIM